jgi:transcriptional regulator with XRE-family HTH domain
MSDLSRPKPSRNVTPTSAQLIERALQRTLRQKELANRLQVDKSYVSRVVAGKRLGFEKCLMLAELLGEDPAVVMNAYGHVRLVKLLQTLYVARGFMPRENSRIHEALDRLPSDDQRAIGNVIDRLLAGPMSSRKGGARC